MSFVSVVPDLVLAASENLSDIGSSLRVAHAAAAVQTSAIVAPAADEVSEAVTSFFGTAGQEFQALGAQAAAFHDAFVTTLSGGAGQYVSAEAANVQQTVAHAVNAPADALIGTGQNAAATIQAATAADYSLLTPFGPISFTSRFIPPNPGPNGAFTGLLTANTPLGVANAAVFGTISTGPTGVPGTEYQVASGRLDFPALPFFLGVTAAPGGPAVLFAGSLLSSFQNALSDAIQGNFSGAATAVASAPANLLDNVLFGTQYVDFPLDTSSLVTGGPTVTVKVPYPGVFATPHPITVSWPTFTTGNTTVDGVTNLPLTGTEVPGTGNALVSTSTAILAPAVDAIDSALKPIGVAIGTIAPGVSAIVGP
jgi:hypothetical protein